MPPSRMNFRRLFFNKYVDRLVFAHLPPELHSPYKLLRYGTYDSERLAMYRRALLWLAVNEVTGSVCEFGSAGGESFLNLYFQFARASAVIPHFFLFDSFEGLPALDERTPHAGWKQGDFRFSLPEFLERMDFYRVPRGAYTPVKGFYNQTLTAENHSRLNMGPLSLVHIDCDLFDSTRLALRFVTQNLQPGTVLLFDDYYCSKADLQMGES